jgi:hypothetical protein
LPLVRVPVHPDPSPAVHRDEPAVSNKIGDPAMNDTLIAIHSCSADIKNGRHNAIRETWMYEAVKHADVRFFVGRENTVPLIGDEIQLDATEDRENLIEKEAAIMRWAHKRYGRILKTETDVYFNVRRLFESNYKCADVVGRVVGTLGEHYGSSNFYSFFQGHATWYTDKAAKLVADHLMFAYEDKMAGFTTWEVGKLDPSKRAADLWSMQALYPFWKAGQITMENDGNYAYGPISYHLLGDYDVKKNTPDWMREMHREHNGR